MTSQLLLTSVGPWLQSSSISSLWSTFPPPPTASTSFAD